MVESHNNGFQIGLVSLAAEAGRYVSEGAMIKAKVQLYLVSEKRLGYLTKEIDFQCLPRTNEWVKLKNEKLGDYFGFKVDEITHREGALPEIMLQPLMKNEFEYDFFEEDELIEYIDSYKEEGWELISLKTNTTCTNEKT